MRARFVGMAAALACLAGAVLYGQDTFVFFARVTDLAGAPVTTLAVADFEVLENKVEGKVLKIEPINWPVKVQLLVDNGFGMAEELVAIRNGIKGFVKELADGIEMSLLTTAP